MKNLLLLALLLPCLCRAQSAYKVFDKTTYSIAEAIRIRDSINAVDPGWTLPSAKDMQNVFTNTFDRRQLRSSITAATCYCADTTAGIMRGREFKNILVGYNSDGSPQRYSFFLIKR